MSKAYAVLKAHRNVQRLADIGHRLRVGEGVGGSGGRLAFDKGEIVDPFAEALQVCTVFIISCPRFGPKPTLNPETISKSRSAKERNRAPY
jgi:hypothetical protein